jgi:hypothetical protein
VTERELVLRLGAAAYPLTLVEAEILADWLHDSRSLAAQALSARITEGLASGPILGTLGLDDIAALREVVCSADVGEHAGLQSLQTSLCESNDH